MVQIQALVLWLMSLKEPIFVLQNSCTSLLNLVCQCTDIYINTNTIIWWNTAFQPEIHTCLSLCAWIWVDSSLIYDNRLLLSPEGRCRLSSMLVSQFHPILSSKELCCAAPGAGVVSIICQNIGASCALSGQCVKLCVCIWVDIGTGPIVLLCCVHYNKGGEENAGGQHFYTAVLGEGSLLCIGVDFRGDAGDMPPSEHVHLSPPQ